MLDVVVAECTMSELISACRWSINALPEVSYVDHHPAKIIGATEFR
jgi:hypothetical protein